MNELRPLATTLHLAIASRSLPHARAVHARLIKLHHHHHYQTFPNPFSLHNKLLLFYSKLGLSTLAHHLFGAIPQRDTVSFNTRLRFITDPVAALSLYSRLLHEGLAPNCITFATFLTVPDVATDSRIVEQVHCHSVKFGLNSDGFVGSAIVNGYEKCRGLKEALCAFEEIDEVDSVSWNIMIDVCARRGSKEHAVELFARMRRESSRGIDSFSLTSVLKTCGDRMDFGLGLQLHACVLKAGFESETPLGNSLITMYSRCRSDMDSAWLVFHRIHEPNVISWTALISGLSQNGMAEEAVRLYKDMVSAGEVENEFLFASILPAFSALSSLESGRMVHTRIIKVDVCFNVGVGNALIDMYFKCGSLEDAQLAFVTRRSHDLVTYTVMISGLGQHGKGREAIEIFKAMRVRGFKPDNITFLAILSACSHVGLVDEGLQLFQSMVDGKVVKPRREHFASVVDMLGRAGRLREAELFIREAEMELDLFAWEALLGACRIHGEMEIGERSARKVMELEPHKDGAYVQLSNIYADRKLWEEKGKVRRRLDDSGLRKETARSWY